METETGQTVLGNIQFYARLAKDYALSYARLATPSTEKMAQQYLSTAVVLWNMALSFEGRNQHKGVGRYLNSLAKKVHFDEPTPARIGGKA